MVINTTTKNLHIIVNMLLWTIFKIAILLLIPTYFFLKKKKVLKNYWVSRGVPQMLPEQFQDPFVGHQFKKIYDHAKKNGDIHQGIIDQFRGRPEYVPTNLDLIKNILIKDFEYFTNRGVEKAHESDPLSMNIFAMEDDRWKSLRAKLTPTFTSGKMKMMFPIFLQCTKSLTDVLKNYENSNEAIDMKELLACFSTDVITSCAFGVECDSLKNPNEPFRVYGRKSLELTPFTIFKLILMKNLPVRLNRLLGIRFRKKEVEQFFIKTVHEMVEYREKNNVYRPDFMHLLLQLKNLGKVTDDRKFQENGKSKAFINMVELTAQCALFFSAGFETSSSVTMFTLYELSKNEQVQDKLRKEIRSVLDKHNGELTYDNIMAMTYLDQVVKEGLRLYPSLAVVTRTCNKNYKVPGTKFELEKGVTVQIPVFGIHTDPEYYPEPFKFNPDHFTKENESKRPPCTWLPFGDGPRLCIGMRFGMMQVKAAIATFIKDFRVVLDPQTPNPLQMMSPILITQCKGKIYLRVEKI